jgi:hypothetical protein
VGGGGGAPPPPPTPPFGLINKSKIPNSQRTKLIMTSYSVRRNRKTQLK